MTWLEISLMAVLPVVVIWLWHRHEEKVKEYEGLKLAVDRLRVNVDVFFSPDGGCAKAICAEIDQAHDVILVMAYYLTSVEIISSLALAVTRDVKVSLITDDKGDNSANLEWLRKNAHEHWVDKRHAIMHNKVMVIDGRVVITGSFNFTENAEENNAENLLIIRSHRAADCYAGNWQTHKQHSVPGKPA